MQNWVKLPGFNFHLTCHDIGITTYMVNRGCNDFQSRVAYYKYFKTDVFNLTNTSVNFSYQGTNSNSYQCTYALYAYCTSP